MFISLSGVMFINFQQGPLLHMCTQGARLVGPPLTGTLLMTMTWGIITGKLLNDFHLKNIHITSIYMSLAKANNMTTSNVRRVGKSNSTHAQRRRVGNIGEKHQCLPYQPLLEFCF